MAGKGSIGRDASAIALGETMLAEVREEVSRADQKASIMLAGAGVAVGAVLGGIVAARWVPAALGMPREIVWWMGVAAVCAGVGLLCAAVYPRLGEPCSGDLIFYFGDVCLKKSRDEIRESLVKTSNDLLDRVADQVYVQSKLAQLKFRLIKLATWTLAAGAVLILAAVMPGSV